MEQYAPKVVGFLIFCAIAYFVLKPVIPAIQKKFSKPAEGEPRDKDEHSGK